MVKNNACSKKFDCKRMNNLIFSYLIRQELFIIRIIHRLGMKSFLYY